METFAGLGKFYKRFVVVVALGLGFSSLGSGDPLSTTCVQEDFGLGIFFPHVCPDCLLAGCFQAPFGSGPGLTASHTMRHQAGLLKPHL
jgi:hypothetical protein